MAGNDFFGDVGRQVLGRTSLLLKHRHVVALRTLRTLLPPQAQR